MHPRGTALLLLQIWADILSRRALPARRLARLGATQDFHHGLLGGGSRLIGRSVGVYQVESLIGAGGMGEVYRAYDTRLNRPVAIKFLSDDLADASARRRFQREAQTPSSLNHPHILTVHDVGELDGRACLVTEFVDGGTLREWTSDSARPWPMAIELLPPGEALGPVLGGDDAVYYRGREGDLWFLYEYTVGTGQTRQVTSDQAVNSPTISPDGQ